MGTHITHSFSFSRNTSALRRLVAILGAIALCVGLAALTAPGTAQAANGPKKPGAAGEKKPGKPDKPADAPAPEPGCTLTDPEQPDSEWAKCTIVDVDLLSKPGIGDTATARVTVRSQRAVRGATVSLGVNENLSLVGDAGFGNARSTRSGVGQLATRSRSVDLAAGGTKTFRFTVRADSKGYGIVQARVRTGDAATTGDAEAAVLLGGASAPSPTGGLAVEEAPENAPQARASSPAKYEAAPVSGPAPLSAQAPGASCATGRWVFNNEVGAQTGSENFQIQVWDADSPSDDDHLATGVTGGNGNYNICFESTDGEGGGQEVYVKFISENSTWRVRNTAAANNNYVFQTGVINLGDPGTANFGTLQPADGALHRALHAFDGLTLMWYWVNGVSACFDDPGECRQMILNWTPTSTDGTYYSLGANDIHLAAADPDADHVTIHEGGHALMDALYNDDYPPFPNCNPHFIFGNSSTGCAWTEGWAEWLPARVLSDPFFRFPSGASVNLETPTWNDGNPHGDQAEGRVAGALIDLSDNNNEAPWDRYGEAEGYGAEFEEIYTTSRLEITDTLNEYFTVDRAGEGSIGFLARTAVFANTINYAALPQRDPLFSNGELTRPSLSLTPSPHNYSFSTSAGYWSGVAIRHGNDNDLVVYDDEGQTVNLGGSAFGGSTLDYVLVDSNSGRRPVGDSYFPRAFLFSGSGSYAIEYHDAPTTIGSTGTSTFGSGDIIDVHDMFLTAGQQEFIRVVPAAGLNVDVNAHVSTATTSTWVQGRGSAAGGSSSGGAGVPESFSFTPGTTGWAGLALVNNGGSGTATIYRDTTAPTASSVVIDGGAASTQDLAVNLALSSTDSQTGIQDMRISVDGTFDTEAFEPYGTSRNRTLPAGPPGTRTVQVQFRNNAGMVTTVSDTITYSPTVPGAPTVTDSTPSGGAVRVAFTPGSDGGSRITSYQAQCVSTDGGVTRIRSKASSPITVTGLTGNRNYHCRVRAINQVGAGPYSAFGATVLVPLTVPAGVTVTSTTPTDVGRLRVAFSPNADGGSPITGFTAQCVSTDGGTTKTRSGAASPITVTLLSSGNNYHCRVRATNSVGTGPYGPYGATVLVP